MLRDNQSRLCLQTMPGASEATAAAFVASRDASLAIEALQDGAGPSFPEMIVDDLGRHWAPAPIAAAFAASFDTALSVRLVRDEIRSLGTLLSEFEAACELGAQAGLTGNQLSISASQAVAKRHGISPTDLLGIASFEAPDSIRHFSPTQLGRHLGITAKELNALLAHNGLQERFASEWVVTAIGKKYAVMVDVGKRHGSGVPVTQLRWRQTVLSVLSPNDLFPMHSGATVNHTRSTY